MAKKPLPSPETLRQLLRYDPETGKLFWLRMKHEEKKWNNNVAGKEAFKTPHCRGYLHGRFKGKPLLAHRVAWAVYNCEWPPEQIDHINGEKTDNRICNLRCVTGPENQRNMKLNPRNKSGYHGVSWQNSSRKWVVRLCFQGKNIFIGKYSNLLDAAAARKAADLRIGFHENHGR